MPLNDYEALDAVMRIFDAELIGFIDREEIRKNIIKRRVQDIRSLDDIGNYYTAMFGALPVKTKCCSYYQDCQNYDKLSETLCVKNPVPQGNCWVPRVYRQPEQMELFNEKIPYSRSCQSA